MQTSALIFAIAPTSAAHSSVNGVCSHSNRRNYFKGIIRPYLHACTHTHLHVVHMERKWMGESYSSGRSPWEVNPVHEVHSNWRILRFHFIGTNPKADWPARKNSAAQPHNDGVQSHTSGTAGSGDSPRGAWKTPTLIVHPSVPPLTRQVVPEGKQSPSPSVLPAEEWISGNTSVPSAFPLHCGRMLHAELHCALPASS